jgi:hypothetical protein
LIVAVVAALLLAGAALGYFTSSGSGSGTSHVGTAADLTFHPGTLAGELFPGTGGVDVHVLVDNPNSFQVHLNGVVLDSGGFAIDGGGHSGCDVSVLSFDGPQNHGGLGWDIPAGNDHPITLSGAVSMSTLADSACQDATFNVYLKAAA